MVQGIYFYRLFGLVINSDIELPELSKTKKSPKFDVRIDLDGPLAESAAPGFHTSNEAMLVVIEGVGRYRIEGGKKITVWPAGQADPRAIRLYLLGSAMGLLLQQRAILPLHANAIVVDGRAIAFMGPSGSGKSTLASWFHGHGLGILGDDVCAIEFDQARNPVAHPGLPRLRLWRDALVASGRSVDDHPRSLPEDDAWDKFDVTLDSHWPDGQNFPLGCLYLLVQGEETSIRRLNGIEAFEAVVANIYRGQFLALTGKANELLQSCMDLARTVPIYEARRGWTSEQFDDEAQILVDHFVTGCACNWDPAGDSPNSLNDQESVSPPSSTVFMKSATDRASGR